MITKKLFSALLSVSVLTCYFSYPDIHEKFTISAADTASVLTGECGSSVTYTLDSEGKLTISGNGTISDFAEGKSPFSDNDKIKTVVIENGVTQIGNYSFSSCPGISSVELPRSLNGIGEFAFENCTSLTSLTIPDSVTSIGQYAFSGTSLKSLVIPESTVTLDTNSMFMDCKELESVVLPQSLTALYSNAFRNCAKLKEVDIPDSVTAIQNDVFAGTTFTSLFIPSEVTMINGNALRDSKIDTICGFKDSAAETFAEKNGLDFVESEERLWKRTDSLPLAGVYKLDCDVNVKSYTTINGILDLDLNGHTVKTPEIICNSSVTIRDSDPGKKGTVICTEDSNLITSYNKLTICGGNFYGYDKKTVCATVRINDGSFDFYGGEITGYYSHALSVRTKDGIINLMGGNLKTSSAENGKTNVYSIWLADTFAGTLNITGGEFHSDLGPAVSGSPLECIVNISGGKISSDQDHGFKFPKRGTVNLSGNISIKGGKGGIYMPKGKTVNISGPITSADVSVYAESSGTLTNGLGKYISASTLKRYLPLISSNGTLSVNDEGELGIEVPVSATTTAVTTAVSSTTATVSTLTDMTSASTTDTSTSAETSTTASASTVSTSVTSTAATASVTEGTKYALGDPNGDGKTDANDATLVLVNYSIMSTGGQCELDAEQQKAADVNSDGRIDASDATLILQYYGYMSTGGTAAFADFIKQNR